jgi:hypothetical protein
MQNRLRRSLTCELGPRIHSSLRLRNQHAERGNCNYLGTYIVSTKDLPIEEGTSQNYPQLYVILDFPNTSLQ